MGRDKKNGVAKFLATLLMKMMVSLPAWADDLTFPQTAADPISLSLTENQLSAVDPSDLLAVFVGQADRCCDGRTPIAGRYVRANGALTFTPAFGFNAGHDYLARVGTAQGEEIIAFQIPTTTEAAPAVVTQIYPSGDTLPENILRFYVHFSVPMQPHVAFDYIKLRDASGAVDEAAFMQFKQELWNADRTRLTVLIDPGRIKRNVATNLELGPALLAGQEYTLSIDAGWPSADGMSRLPGFSKQFVVTEPLRELPDVGLWEITRPCVGSNAPLRITFDRPFDRHLLGQTMHVISADGEVIEGAVEIADGERYWTFIPNEDWHINGAQVLVSAELEDVAANNFRDLLDHVGSDEAIDLSTIAVPMTLKACQE